MTASLPVPNDIDPEEPDRHESAAVVSLPSSPKAPAAKRPAARKNASKKSASSSASAAAPAESGAKTPPKPRAPRQTPKTKAKAAPSTDPAASESVAAAEESVVPVEELVTPEEESVAPAEESVAPAENSIAPAPQVADAADPGPPPPLPSDLDVAAPADADIVIPPKPPLPDEAVTASADPATTEEAFAAEAAPAVEAASAPVALQPADVPADVGSIQDERAEERDVPAPVSDEPQPIAEAVPEVLTAPAVEGDVLVLRGVSKRFGDTLAVDSIDLTVPAGTFYGLVGPNGAGKTTTLSMIAGLLEPDRGSIRVGGVNAASDPVGAKRLMGVLPDRLRTFDRLTGRQLLYYYGVLRGLAPAVVESRTADLARAFDLTDALGRAVSDYSAGMVKKVMLAGALIHSPRVLVLDEPFEAVDPVSSAIILDILSTYVTHGGTVILSSHGMELVERVCSRVAVIVAGQVLAEGTIDEVRGELSLEQRFIELAGGLSDVEGLEWLHTFSD